MLRHKLKVYREGRSVLVSKKCWPATLQSLSAVTACLAAHGHKLSMVTGLPSVTLRCTSGAVRRSSSQSPSAHHGITEARRHQTALTRGRRFRRLRRVSFYQTPGLARAVAHHAAVHQMYPCKLKSGRMSGWKAGQSQFP